MVREWKTLKRFLFWEIALGLLLVIIFGTVSGLRMVTANDYIKQGLLTAALYTFQSMFNRIGLVVLGATVAVCAVSFICFLSRHRARVAALFVAIPASVYTGYILGYELNRYDFKPYWLETQTVFGIPIRSAFLTPKVVAMNGAILIAMLLAGWVCYKLAIRLWRYVRNLRGRFGEPFRPGWLVLLFALLLLVGQAACLLHRATHRPAGPNVILISLDTLRGDHLGCYGYDRPVTPNIDRFVSSSVLFENAVAQAGSTLPSHKSVMTSLYPPQLRTRSGRRLDRHRITLSELMLNAGYRTAAFANGLGWVTPVYHFEQGFDTYIVPSLQLIPRVADAEEITRLALSWMRGRRSRPFFLFLHYGDIHSDFNVLPYEAPEPYQSMFLDPDAPPLDVSRAGAHGSQYLGAINAGRYTPTDEEMAQIRAMYDGGIRYTDAHLGELFRGIEELGLLNNTMVVMFSDHGEEFGEHGRVAHGWVYREVARVPLIIRFPEGAWGGTRIRDLVQLLDITPTILDRVQIPATTEMLGRNLVTLIENGGDVSRAYTEGAEAYALRTLGWMFRYEVEDEYKEMYDLHNDPEEQHDLIGNKPEDEKRLEATLLTWMDLVGAGKPVAPDAALDNIDRRTLELLKSLGYIQ
ncbi:MAG: sulfatase-like hydrolase/transferase [Candidatus Latescibacteria bacterium]|nr:sulfatase-like hydrolase/transferase [Candidatus Latescibacterota bacterium]NIM66056.1 sulfatase-like hydrolase/transferase [Candidatus Latescibacterota bacterium]NIO02464.1 sulfatase-like hydrolase/transferase [Candidatus Latescibacterota bacterium]NIO29375.1 sulfatase-like hydrolase/transferase [Candidatus Latescibacterota bacterium]NIO57093.1 sulfatase-like hydrolase/transferase [Candidatus Latescibacterota bacterium]